MRVPIIPPYTPETGITQTPAVDRLRRPPKGQLTSDEQRAEWLYLPEALKIVRELWGERAVPDIALEIYHRTGYRNATVRLVYALKARLDTLERNRSL